MLLPQSPRWQRAVIVALLTLPVLAIILLSSPVWLVLPFTASGKVFILEMTDKLTDCLKAFMRDHDRK
ncbi:hypothetical protein GCM10023194_79450 [Planotetraspora phitsanulokensis]|uniref:Uncharacterized protein n=1 Tax=Planotetraspora phitsanulokensis TaxID=575192 RepID=A0A8J3UBX4_9ACTN|nr:hypothetical protein Pph01_67290 [Planotetraspora phitsanulokensis]